MPCAFLSTIIAPRFSRASFNPRPGKRDEAMPEVILETRDLTKEFKGFVAVSGINLRVREGDVHALIGPNGAGKTTVFNLLTKFLIPTSGAILYRPVSRAAASSAHFKSPRCSRISRYWRMSASACSAS